MNVHKDLESQSGRVALRKTRNPGSSMYGTAKDIQLLPGRYLSLVGPF